MLRRLQDRPRPGRSSGYVGLALAAVLWAVFCLPVFSCPCQGRPNTVPLSPPTEDRFEFRMTFCGWCEGSGRLPFYDQWRADLASR